ncbi:unnamed protein product [Rhizophagus irregularis]|nr:unnamed protein product [Rhizophagus irregularis]
MPVDELKLENELEDIIAVLFYKTEIIESTFQINDQEYHPGRSRICDNCQIVQEDWNIYHMIREHIIITEEVPPIKKRAYRTAPKENEFIESEINDMLEQGLIKPSTSPWSFPVVVAKKKNRKLRFCVNYKPLNDITKKNNYL